jgi:hypothetical protein
VHELTYGRAVEAARLVPVGSHTAVEASTIDCIFRASSIRVTVGETIFCTDLGGFKMVADVPKVWREKIHLLLHNALYSAVVRAG